MSQAVSDWSIAGTKLSVYFWFQQLDVKFWNLFYSEASMMERAFVSDSFLALGTLEYSFQEYINNLRKKNVMVW